ncbi:hypothetical protein N7510_009878 [Penicillium lagena]|uniref:uncharacterized protein n=1 Tax=Penicillium lagena TaxID=94218 RepID=UPI0025425ADA|nr:uncharacterized protein N7510_009878 [Penicillium lagena]KAJ5604724.1 hypothetical protein N7510_009878 [Penicillium lagena]
MSTVAARPLSSNCVAHEFSSESANMFTPTLRRAAAQASSFGPKYYTPRHVGGVNLSTLTQAGTLAGSFGVAAGVFAVFFFGEVPRVRKDILQKIPGLDVYFDRTVAPEDNPF